MNLKLIFAVFFLPLISICAQEKSEAATTLELEQKMNSKNHEDRRDAALILGKYINLRSSELLVNALKDENQLVRRASLVSLQDRLMKRYLNDEYYPTLFETLKDKDAEIRRISSGMLLYYLPIMLTMSGDPRNVEANIYSRDSLINQVIMSSEDSDSGVRKNIMTFLLQYKYMIRNQTHLQSLKKRLADTEDDICILALGVFPRSGVNIKKELLELANRKKANVNMAILNYMTQDATIESDTLKELVNSSDLEVKIEALIYDVKSGNREHIKAYLEFLELNTNPIHLRLKSYDITKILAFSSIDMKTEVFKSIDFFVDPQKAVELLEQELKELNSANYQKILIQKLLQLKRNLTSKELSSYFSNKDVGIRKMILSHCLQNNINSEDILFEGLLDDLEDIRIFTLDLIARQIRVETSTLDMLVQFLEDPSVAIQSKSYSILLKHNNENTLLPLLLKIQDSKNETAKRYICELISSYKSTQALDLIQKYTKDPSVDVRTKAYFTLYTKDQNTYAPKIAELLGDKDLPAHTKLSIARLLHNKFDLLAKHADSLASDENLDLRWNFIKIFINKKGFLSEKLLTKRINAETNNMVIETLLFLLNQEQYHGDDLLKSMLKSQTKKVRYNATNLINNNYKESMEPFIEELLKSNDSTDHTNASIIISTHTLKKFDKDIVALAESNTQSNLLFLFFYCLAKLNTEKGNAHFEKVKNNPSQKPIYDRVLLEIQRETNRLNKEK